MTTPDSCAYPVANEPGLTKREVIAIAAMQGLWANPNCRDLMENEIARIAVNQANALITALNKESK